MKFLPKKGDEVLITSTKVRATVSAILGGKNKGKVEVTWYTAVEGHWYTANTMHTLIAKPSELTPIHQYRK